MAKKVNKKNMSGCNYAIHCGHHFGGHGCAYGLGVLGAAIYYVSIATGFWMGVLGILKALVWPAFLIFEMLKFLGA